MTQAPTIHFRTAKAVQEQHPAVRAYIKNQNLGFTIPYTLGGQERQYVLDFLVKIDDGHPDPLNLILECGGER